MSNKIRLYIYEILSSSFGIAILGFFGTFAFFPPEMTILGVGSTWFYTFVFLCLGVVIAFILLSLYKEKSLIIIRIVDFVVTIIAILVVIVFLTFTRDLMEPWLFQAAWFFHYNGIFIGIFLGAIMIKTVAGLSILSTQFFDGDIKTDKRKNSERLTLIIISSSFGFYILEILLFRHYMMLSALLSIFIIQICLLLMSIILMTQISLVQVNENVAEQISSRKRFQKLNLKLNKSGVDIKGFYWLLVPLLCITAICILIIIIYPFEPTMLFIIPPPLFENEILIEILMVQFFSYLLIAAMLFILFFTVYGGRARKQLELRDKKIKHLHLKSSSLGALDALKVLGIFLVVSQILYFYEYPLFYPRVVSYYLLFGIVGAIIYFTLGRNDKLKLLIYSLAIFTLILNLYLTYVDGIEYAEDVFDVNYEISFPFLYLHSWTNFILVGIPVGIILSDVFLSLMFKHTDGSDSVNRALLIPYAVFLGFAILMIGNWLLNNPGGEPPHDVHDPVVFTYFCLGLGITLFNGLMFHYISELIIPFVQKRRGKKVKEKPSEIKKEKKSPQRPDLERREPAKKKAIAISLTAAILISVLGGFMIYYAYQENYQKPVVAYSPGDYYIWVQNSSERVAKNTQICVESSPKIDAVELSLAKNEYGAFQMVWRPLRSYIHSLTYEISDFMHEDSSKDIIQSGNCSLRYEEYIIEEEFPDILKPFSKMNLHKIENYIFWFSMKTPYDIKEGEYKGEITFTFNTDETETIKIRLNVWNFTIPETRHLSTNIGSHSTSYSRMENYFYHRANDYGLGFSYTTDYTRFQDNETTCYLNESSNDWEFNWTYWDNMIQYKLDGGMNAFSLPYPAGIHKSRVPIKSETEVTRYKNWLTKVQSHLETKNWLNYSFIYFIDEFQMFIPEGYTREEYFDALEDLLKEMKNAAPKIKIMATAPPTEELEHLYKYIDIWCPVSADRDKERWDDELDEGKEMWMYACVGPSAPWPNSHLYNRLYECRILLWQVWLYELHGFLYWSSVGYYHGRNGFAYNGYGDGWFIFERDGTIYDTPRWENYLDAMEDYEYLWLLDAILDYLKENPGIISKNKCKAYRNELESIVNEIVGERWKYCDHSSTLNNGRNRIGEILDKLGADIDISAIGEAPWAPPYYPNQ